MNPGLITLLAILALGLVWKCCVLVMNRRKSLASHRAMCTVYNRCPECRVQQELPSRLDWMDRFR